MASYTKTYYGKFKWIIHSPFNPAQTMKAKFYQETPTVKEWLVKLYFKERRVGEWDILFSLIFDNRRDERPDIVVNRLVTRIILNEQPIAEVDLPRYEFKEENRHRYHLETSAFMFAQKQSKLVVEIKISLEEDAIKELFLQRQLERNLEGNLFLYDLRCLSEDLHRLVLSPNSFYNVDLHSSNGEVYRVHSYILSVRWSNLFQRHSFGTTANTVVRTNISSELLTDILVYMYSALIIGIIQKVKSLQYRAELFKVIDWYGIYHLYKVFVQRECFQLRASRKPEIIKTYNFRLHFTSGLVRDVSINLNPQEYSKTLDFQHQENELQLRIEVCHWNRVGPWLSYSLKSRANCWFYAQVNLKIVKIRWTGNFNPQREVVSSVTVHAVNYDIRPNAYIVSGPVLFLGCLETFGDFPSMPLPGKIEQCFRFTISFNDGTSLDQVQSDNKTALDGLTRLNVLSNHMYKLCSKEIHADMRLLSHSIYEDTVVAIRCVHKAILATRVPRMYGLLANFGTGSMLPAEAKVQLRQEALAYVVDYIYTGKVINPPKYLLSSMSDFANRCNLPTLKKLMNVLRG